MSSSFTARVVPSIATIDAAAWDACANPPGRSYEEAEGERFNPFITHAFLHALEASGSVGGRSGWTPAHLAVEDASGRMVAAAACYLKSHSQGEYVFDHAWADAYERAGGDYYPKLQVAVPFTPGDRTPPPRRRRCARGRARGADRGARANCANRPRRRQFTSPSRPPRTRNACPTHGFLIRNGEQFHFFCDGFSTFDDFLGALASRKRKAIKRERRDALDGDVTIEPLTGSAIRPEHWDAFFKFYMHTGSRKWGRPYLTRAFFELIGSTLADRVLLVMARRAGRYIAGAINFIGDDALYGRNWGAIEHRPFLHFEVCYYQAIDFALSRGLRRIEAGAQGEHKLARGYRPTLTYSAHEFADARLARAIADYLGHEREAVERTIAHYEDYAPFRRGEAASKGPKEMGEAFDAEV